MELRSQEGMLDEGGVVMDLMEEERAGGAVRPKRWVALFAWCYALPRVHGVTRY